LKLGFFLSHKLASLRTTPKRYTDFLKELPLFVLEKLKATLSQTIILEKSPSRTSASSFFSLIFSIKASELPNGIKFSDLTIAPIRL
jgi:hypothetical protein